MEKIEMININTKEIIKTIKSNWILILILLIGAFMRLYNIEGYMTFLGDEGRDVIVVRNLLVNFDPILIGPGTSVGGMYLGPLYYYFMAPFLLLSNFSPVGPAVGVALLGVLTIYLVYLVGKEWFSKSVGLVASILFAVSPPVIIYSHSSWNPNIMPFFALLSVYSIWKVFEQKKLVKSKRNYKWFYITAIAFAFVMQSHYLGILLGPVLFIYWVLSKVPLKNTLIAASIFLFLMSPLLIFDIRHDWMNARAFHKFITVRQETVSIRPWTAIPKAYPIFEQINTSLLAAKNEKVGGIVTLSIVLSFVLMFLINRKKFIGDYLLLLTWLISGLIGFGIYKQHIYDHYFGFLFPIPFLLVGILFGKVYKTKFKILAFVILGYILVVNILDNPFRYNPNNQMQRSENVAKKVIEISEGKAFNFAVLAERNYEDGYKYFLDINGVKTLHADIWNPESIAETLIVVCEMEPAKCDPTHSAKAEVANFGMSEIENQWETDGVIIYKLVHSKKQ